MHIISNGGLSSYFKKNSVEGILANKYDECSCGTMIDICFSNDENLVVYENDHLYKDNYISKMNYDDIKKVRFNDTKYRYYIPKLEDILPNYNEDILLLNLHNSYDNNEEFILKLKSILDKYPKNYVLIVNNDNLYEYAKKYLNYPVYMSDSKEICFVNVNLVNYNDKVILKNDKIYNPELTEYLITNYPKAFYDK